MKKNVLLYSSVWLFVCMLCSCASVPAPQQETTFEQELFSPAYIAVRGYGQSGQDAEQNALAALSRYFSSHVTVETAQKTVVKDTASYSRLEDVTRVLSDTELFAVHYTKPRFNAAANQYEAIAYINRAEAQQLYEPKIKAAVQPFSAFYTQAERESDVFKRMLLYVEAQRVVHDNAALKVLHFLHVLSPDDAVLYESIEDQMNTLDAKINETRGQCTVAVDLTGSDAAQVKSITEEIISQFGFPLVKEALCAAYLCTVTIEEHKTVLPAGVFFTPSIDIRIVSQNGGTTVFSYSKTISRLGASSEAAAKKRMEHAITSELKSSLPPSLTGGK